MDYIRQDTLQIFLNHGKSNDRFNMRPHAIEHKRDKEDLLKLRHDQ